MLRTNAALALALLLCVSPPLIAAASSPPREQTWLVLSDIHLNPFDRDEYPARVGSDTNLSLFDQTVAQMRQSVPNPSLVLLPGDFLAHGFPGKAHEGAPASSVAEAALRTMQRVATSLGKAYPHAHFAIALGNNDASCGDYRTDAGNAYLRELASIWEPLVDRGRSAPDFVHRFSTGGYYTVALPVRGLRLVVVNSVPMSSAYRGNCGEPGTSIARNELTWLHAQLASTPPGTANVVMMHIPPGYDPVTTQYTHGLIAWAFLHGDDNATLLGLLADPRYRVRYAIAGHLHRFDFRLTGGTPILIFSSLSPVYRNNPAFFAMHVGDNGVINDIDAYVYDEWSGDWADDPRSFDDKWGVQRIDGQSLASLHARLESEESLREKWAFGSAAWPSNPDFRWDAWASNRWRIPWCAQVELDGGYVQCADIGNRVAAFRISLVLIALGIVAAVLLLIGIVRRRQTR